MSRIGKLPINIPVGVSVTATDQVIHVKGPDGELFQEYLPLVSVEVRDNVCIVTRINDSKPACSMHGLYRSLIQNMVIGVSQGFTKTLEIHGIGYRAELNGTILLLNLGYSMPIEYVIPDGITITLEVRKQNMLVIKGISKEQVGRIASEIRSLRPPEPYKGKGIRYANERLIRKVGKSGVK